jgi:Protein of unknown function (DUF1236)
MSGSLRRGVILIGVLGWVALAAAGTATAADDIVTDETTGSLGPQPHELALSDEQRGRIYDGVMDIHDAPVVRVPAPELAQALPRGVAMQDLPAGVIRAIPQVRGHKFVKFDDRILVVDPASRLVVAMIPRYKLMD